MEVSGSPSLFLISAVLLKLVTLQEILQNEGNTEAHNSINRQTLHETILPAFVPDSFNQNIYGPRQLYQFREHSATSDPDITNVNVNTETS